jgi:pyruvate kinase
MPRYVSNMRPEHAPIFAFTPSEEICRKLLLCWGTHPKVIAFTDDPNATILVAEKFLLDAKLIETNDNLVILSDILAEGERFDCVQLRQVKT